MKPILFCEIWMGDGRRGIYHEGPSVFLGCVVIGDDLLNLPFAKRPNVHAHVVATLANGKTAVNDLIHDGKRILRRRT